MKKCYAPRYTLSVSTDTGRICSCNITKNSQFNKFNFVQLGRYEDVYSDSKTTGIKVSRKDGIVGRGLPYSQSPTMYCPEFIRNDMVQHRFLRTPYVKKELIQMYTKDNYIPYGRQDSEKTWGIPFLEMPYVQPFCSNKTLKHMFWKFQHKPTGNNDWIKGTIYYKIRCKIIFSCYFKTGHIQGTETATIDSGGKSYRLSNIVKDIGGDTIHHVTTLKNPLNFHKMNVQDRHFRIFHPKSCLIYTEKDDIKV